MAVSPAKAAAALRTFQRALPTAVLRGLRKGLPIARKIAITKYMERKDNRGASFDPANPPPGPLGIRQGNLVRTVRVGEMRFNGKRVFASIAAGSPDVRYARIHEKGGIIAINPGPRASFVGPRREQPITATSRVFIMPARPYLRPAMDEATPQIIAIVSKEVLILARVTLQGVAKIR